MNYNLISALLRGKWAIDPQFAINALPMIADILSGNLEVESDDQDVEKQSKVFKGLKANGYTFYGWDDAPKGSVAVIRVMGSLTKNSQWCGPQGMADIGEDIKKAANLQNIAGIVLHIDSPGGTVDGTEALADIVKATRKPVVTFMDGLMASAALWIGSSADEIIASNPLDEIGSVGVLLSFADVQPMWEKEGVKIHTIVSNLSKDKVKMWEDLRAGKYDEYRKEVLDPLAEQFSQTMRENLPGIKDEHLTGKVFFAKDVMNTMVDSIGTIEDAIDRVAELAKSNIKNQNKPTQMKNFPRINKALSVQSLEAVDGHVSINETQLVSMEAVLEAAEKSAETAKKEKSDEVAAVTKEKETADNALKNAITAINAVDESVEKAESIEDKTTAITAYVAEIKKKPAGSGEELKPNGEIEKTAGEKATVKESDSMDEAIGKIGAEFGIPGYEKK